MANIKSAKKRSKTNEVQRKRNVARVSDLKTAIKKVHLALDQRDLEAARESFKVVESKISRARGKGVLKSNTASRKVSRLAKMVKEASTAAPA